MFVGFFYFWKEVAVMSWRTEKQKQCIEDMMEFSNYIARYAELAHEDVGSPTFGY